MSTSVERRKGGSVEKRGRKRKQPEPSPLDILVQEYADNWVRWLGYLEGEEGVRLRADQAASRDVWEHVKQYKRKLDTWPQKDKRKAFRTIYRLLRPAPGSGALSMISSAPSVSSPLALPQLESPPPVATLQGFALMDDLVDLDDPSQPIERDVKHGAAYTAAALLIASSAATASIFVVPTKLVLHAPFQGGGTVLTQHLPEFHHHATEGEVIEVLKRVVDTDINYLANQRCGGHLVLGVEAGVTKGYFMGRKMRDRVRIVVDNQMSRWDPPPHLQHLVDVWFVDVVSPAAQRSITDHCVLWVEVRPSQHPIRNSRGEISRGPGTTAQRRTPERRQSIAGGSGASNSQYKKRW